jgi:hypothetical protein
MVRDDFGLAICSGMRHIELPVKDDKHIGSPLAVIE